MVAILIGILFIAAGLWGIACWYPDFLVVARGLGPLTLLLGGLVTLVAGFSSVGSKSSDAKKK